MSKKPNSPIGRHWDEVRVESCMPVEIAASDLRDAIIGEFVKARQEQGLSQKISDVKSPIIARMEKGSTKPQLDTVLKVLVP
jgi:hypothetical protein